MQNGKSQSVGPLLAQFLCCKTPVLFCRREQLLTAKWASPLMSLLFFAHSKEAEDEQKRGGGGEGVT